MREFTLVKPGYVVRTIPMRELILFDRVGYTDLAAGLEDLRFGEHSRTWIADQLEWLQDEGLIFEVPVPDPGPNLDKSADDLLLEYLYSLDEHKKEMERRRALFEAAGSSVMQISREEAERTMGIQDRMISNRVRLAAHILSTNCDVDAVPQIPSIASLDLPTERRSVVINVVIGGLPVPSPTTPLEQIREFRQDPESHYKYRALRRWISEMASGSKPLADLDEEIEWHLLEYQRHLAMHRLRYSSGAVETVVVSASEFAEDLVKFKWGKIAKAAFSLRRSHASLLEAESNAPGRELGYLAHARSMLACE